MTKANEKDPWGRGDPASGSEVTAGTLGERLAPYQLWLLAILTVLLLWAAPDAWRFFPDSGIYIGTAENLLATGAYVFNGYPNLHFYPGFPLLLAMPIALFGPSFPVLHLYGAALALACVWLARFYFSPQRYGVVGALLPFLLLSHVLIQEQIFIILSDGVFLLCVLGAALTWRKFTESGSPWLLATCVLIVAYSPLVRFNGLLLIASFGIALLLEASRAPERRLVGLIKAVALGAMTLVPFLVWTWRNYVLHTPDTHSMSNKFFFGLKDISIYAVPPGPAVEWIDASWKVPIYKMAFSAEELVEGFFSHNVAAHLSIEVALAMLFVLLIAGAWAWIQSANNLERAYVVISVLFALYWMSGGGLYFQNRQLWLPVLPFLIVISAFGVRALWQAMSRTPLMTVTTVLVGCLAFLVMQSGLTRALDSASPLSAKRDQAINATLQRLAEFVEQEIPSDMKIMSADWGVLPRTLKRTSFQITNDPSHRATLQRMVKYDTRYLVIMDGVDKLVPVARQMVEDLPTLFTEVYGTEGAKAGVFSAVYKIDLEAVRTHLEKSSEP